jgi:DNA sulfur modification protein DndB
MAVIFTVIKGEQGTHTYYVTNLEFGEIATLVVLPEDPLGDTLLNADDTMQRKLSWSRVKKDMKEYLLRNDDAFYSALTLFIVPRDLAPLEEGQGYTFEPSGLDGSGKLILRSGVVLFPADGQHRAGSIKEALKEEPGLAGKQVPVVLVPYERPQVVRQLFSDLNLNAKPISKTVGLSFETRDPVTLIAKEMLDEVQLFKGRVNRASNSLPHSSSKVITLSTLHTMTKELLTSLGNDLGDLSPRALPIAARELIGLYDAIISAFPQWVDLMHGRVSPGDLRKSYIFPHGIGWQAIAQAAAVILKIESRNGGDALRAINGALAKIDWKRLNPDFQGFAIIGDRIVNTGHGSRALAGYVLLKAGYAGEAEAASLTQLYRKSALNVAA